MLLREWLYFSLQCIRIKEYFEVSSHAAFVCELATLRYADEARQEMEMHGKK